jgi:transcriptional regulator with XRE-family HTH domain
MASKQIPQPASEVDMYGRAIKLIREYHRLSQADVASSIKISRSYISEIEGDIKKPSIEVLERYAEFFRLPLSALLLFSEAVEEPSAAESVRKFAADKALKLLEWLRDSAELGDVVDDTTASGLLSVRGRVSGGPRPQTKEHRRRA